MDARRTLTAIGAGLTTGLLVAVLVMELLPVAFSAFVALPVGLLVGLLALAGLAAAFDDLAPALQRAAGCYAAFGVSVLVLFALSYANFGTVRQILPVRIVAGAGVAAGACTYAVLWVLDEGTDAT